MKHRPSLLLPCLWMALAPAPPMAAQGPAKRISISIRDADLKDVLRAAAEDTDLNLSFDPALDTRIKGLDLKGVTLEEILEQVLPNLGLGYVRTGRTIHIQKSDGGLRFYSVDYLSLQRQGKKSFSVNASGQLIQAGGSGGGSSSGGSSGGGSGGSSSAYSSSLDTASGSDPWQELRQGLYALIYGEGQSSDGAESGVSKAPTTTSFAKDGKTLVIQPDSGLVMVGADPSTQSRVARYLDEVRRRHRRQIILEARIVEVTLGHDSQIGVDWNSLLSRGGASGGTGTDIRGTFATGDTINANVAANMGLAKLVVQNARVSAALSALAREGRLQVLSSPRLATLNNQKAILRVVREEAFFLQNSTTTGGASSGFTTTVTIMPMVVPVGIILDIQPQIAEDGGISLAVNPSVSEIVTVRTLAVGDSTSGGASASLPVVDRRDLDTVVRMRSGETLVLAGIIHAKDSIDDRGVPWLRRIPLLGNLFTKREKTRTHTELAIFITPTLVEEPDQVEAFREKVEKRLEESGGKLDSKPETRPGITAP